MVVRKLFNSWFRRARYGADIKIPWHAKLRGKVRSICYRTVSAVFGFHNPAWVTTVGSVMRPPAQAIKPVHYANPIYWLVWAGRFAWNWLTSRPYTSLGAAVPIVLVASGLVTLLVEMQFRNSAQKELVYRSVLSNAVAAKDFDRAVIALGTLTDLDPTDLSFRYQRALVEHERGEYELARDHMVRLAAGKQYGDAALWLVQHEMDLKNMGEWKPEDRERFLQWTEIALANESSRMPARMLMASYLYGIGAYAECLDHFVEIGKVYPEYTLTVAAVYKQLNDLPNAQDWATRATKHYEDALRQNPTNRQARLNLARALIILHKELEASRMLREGFDLSQQQDQELRTASAEALIGRYMRLSELPSSPELLIQQMQLVKGAMDIAPDSSRVMDAVIEVLLRYRENRDSEVDTLRRAMVQGIGPESTHFIQGTLALLKNDFATAKTQLELAAKHNQNLPGILNNLAVAMARMENGNLEDALVLVNSALETAPNQPYFRDTRGQILVKMKRYKEAVPDLEAALKAPEIAREAHESLAICYKEIGLLDLANDHQRMAELLKSRSKTNTSTAVAPSPQKSQP